MLATGFLAPAFESTNLCTIDSAFSRFRLFKSFTRLSANIALSVASNKFAGVSETSFGAARDTYGTMASELVMGTTLDGDLLGEGAAS